MIYNSLSQNIAPNISEETSRQRKELRYGCKSIINVESTMNCNIKFINIEYEDYNKDELDKAILV